MRRLLPTFVFQAFLCLVLSTGLFLRGNLPGVVAAHVAFAVAIMPLILAAMLHFIAVMTRSAAPHWAVAALPVVAWGGGLTMLGHFAPFGYGPGYLHGGAALALVAAFTILLWSMRRVIFCLGTPHPGVHWYQAALLCLSLALIMVFAMAALPRFHRELRLIHLHLNTLGFVGLSALGTLEVLVPTVLGRPDAQATRRLRQGLLPALAGVMLVGIGAAWQPWLAQLGALALLLVALRAVGAWWRLAIGDPPARDGAAAALVFVPAGFVGMLAIGALQGLGLIGSFAIVPGFIAAFLLPLVTGAASHLLPAWWRPGPQGHWHAEFRRRLSRFALSRGLLFVAGGLGAAAGWAEALWLAAAGLILFAAALLHALAGARRDGQLGPSR